MSFFCFQYIYYYFSCGVPSKICRWCQVDNSSKQSLMYISCIWTCHYLFCPVCSHVFNLFMLAFTCAWSPWLKTQLSPAATMSLLVPQLKQKRGRFLASLTRARRRASVLVDSRGSRTQLASVIPELNGALQQLEEVTDTLSSVLTTEEELDQVRVYLAEAEKQHEEQGWKSWCFLVFLTPRNFVLRVLHWKKWDIMYSRSTYSCAEIAVAWNNCGV